MAELHCLNIGFGDASIIISKSAVFLVDCYNIGDHSHLLPPNKNLHGVIITHQHKDHYSGLLYLRQHGYTIDRLIYSPYQRRKGDNSIKQSEWEEFNSLKDYFASKGTKLYQPYRQINFTKPWWQTNGVTFEVMGPYSGIADSATREIHDASLVIKATFGSRTCLFTGDASNANLEYIARNTKNYCDDILHASHHGGLDGASLEFIKKCSTKYTLISTLSDVYENIPHPTALRRYRKYTEQDVHRTDIGGSWKCTSDF